MGWNLSWDEAQGMQWEVREKGAEPVHWEQMIKSIEWQTKAFEFYV